MTLKTPWGEGILFADHGVDDVSINQGGKAKLLVKDGVSGKFIDYSFKIDSPENFIFNVVAPKRNGEEFNDILIVPYNTHFSKPYYWKVVNNEYVDRSSELPKEWLSQEHCSMTGISFDFENDGTDEVILGGCDQDTIYNPSLNDRVMKYVGDKWLYLPTDTLPKRVGSLGWGSVFYIKMI